MSAPCQCRPGCSFTADEGHPFLLAHDKRPEREEERRRGLAERQQNGGRASGESRRATSKGAARAGLSRALREPVPLKTEADIRQYLEVLAAAARFGGITPARIAAGVRAAQAAQGLLAAELDKKAAALAELGEELERARGTRGEDLSQ